VMPQCSGGRSGLNRFPAVFPLFPSSSLPSPPRCSSSTFHRLINLFSPLRRSSWIINGNQSCALPRWFFLVLSANRKRKYASPPVPVHSEKSIQTDDLPLKPSSRNQSRNKHFSKKSSALSPFHSTFCPPPPVLPLPAIKISS